MSSPALPTGITEILVNGHKFACPLIALALIIAAIDAIRRRNLPEQRAAHVEVPETDDM